MRQCVGRRQRSFGNQSSFRPETALFRRGVVNLRSCLCGVRVYASAQALDFLATTKNPSFPNRKLHHLIYLSIWEYSS